MNMNPILKHHDKEQLFYAVILLMGVVTTSSAKKSGPIRFIYGMGSILNFF